MTYGQKSQLEAAVIELAEVLERVERIRRELIGSNESDAADILDDATADLLSATDLIGEAIKK